MASIRAVLAEALGDRADLLDEAAAAFAAGAAAWPGVSVPPAALAARIVARAEVAGPADGVDLHDDDLYLATALSGGDAAAMAAFEARFVGDIDAALVRMRLTPSMSDEVRQAVRIDLLVSAGGEAARIEGYLGIGSLSGWLRVTATRRALKLLRTSGREQPLDEAVLAGWPDATPDPQRAHFQREYAGHLKAALADALATLEVRERNLLRQSILDDLTVEELALIYRVHRSTCARWLVDARAALARATRRALSDRLGPRDGRVESVLRFVESDLELSLSRLLRDPAAAPP